MGIKELLSKLRRKDERFEELKKELKYRKILEERQKSANERELERYYEEQRQERIKEQLGRIRKEKNKEWFSDNMFNQKGTVLNSDRNILCPDINNFSLKTNMFGKGTFFK